MFSAACDSLSAWRNQARSLLAQGVPPAQVCWNSEQMPGLFAEQATEIFAGSAAQSKTPSQHCVPKAFLDIAQSVACYRDEQKWARLYRVLWRLVHENRNLLSLASDADMRWINKATRAVGRDCHKMKAFVRFSKLAADTEMAGREDAYVAWFEPQHLIVERMASFFVKRFTGMTWSILTPDRCCHWDQQKLTYSYGIAKPENLSDELNELWLAYYANIFNPARIKINAMVKEMPKGYWKNLPEAQVIKELLAKSGGSLSAMFDATPCDPDALRNKSKTLKLQQDALRQVALRKN